MNNTQIMSRYHRGNILLVTYQSRSCQYCRRHAGKGRPRQWGLERVGDSESAAASEEEEEEETGSERREGGCARQLWPAASGGGGLLEGVGGRPPGETSNEVVGLVHSFLFFFWGFHPFF